MGYVPAADADDLMQDVFLAAWRALPELNDTSAFGAWLSTIARNRARRHLARRIVLEPLPDELVDTAPPSRPNHTPGGE